MVTDPQTDKMTDGQMNEQTDRWLYKHDFIRAPQLGLLIREVKIY